MELKRHHHHHTANVRILKLDIVLIYIQLFLYNMVCYKIVYDSYDINTPRVNCIYNYIIHTRAGVS